MFADTVARAIEAAHPSKLDELSRSIWRGLSTGALGEDDAQRLAEVIHARRAVAKASQKPVQRRQGSRPRSPASMERRRSWAASGRLPPQLAARFTLAEQAVLAVIALQVELHGACALTLDHIAALAGVSRKTVKNALREAHGLGLVRIEERRLTAWRNAPNRVTVTSAAWSAWIRMRSRAKGGGGKSVPPTATGRQKGRPFRADRLPENEGVGPLERPSGHSPARSHAGGIAMVQTEPRR